jgi:tripeptide aminopeptidase
MIQPERLARVFMELVRVDSVSREEAAIAALLEERLASLGASVVRDGSAPLTGSTTGNLIAKVPGAENAPPLLLCAHMDTVEPGRGVRPRLENGVFFSDGTTILGADDKSALAVILEVLAVLRENSLPRCPLEIVFTTAEEIGLLGAKHLDYSFLSAKMGYALDTSGTGRLVTQAPSANRLEFVVHGKDAHAGTAPEQGANAILMAARALSRLTTGRIDAETTCNIGVIEGGAATNIVPARVRVLGEARSHSEEKLARVTEAMVRAFSEAVDEARREYADRFALPPAEIRVERDFGLIHIPADHPLVGLASRAAANLGRELDLYRSGGGADANVMCGHGIMVGVLGTGMRDMHTVRESVALCDMVECAELVLEVVRLGAGPL